MNKKADSTGAIIGTVMGILFLIAIVVVIIIVVQKGKVPEETIEENMKFYLKAKDEVSGEFLDTNYGVYANNTLISQGNLSKDSLTEIEVPRNTLEIYAYNDDYYFRKAYKIFTPNELIENSSKMTIDLLKVGNIKVTHEGKLSSDTTQTIKLNITSVGWFYKPKICISWTAGIISVNKPNNYLTCEKGIWLNYSEFNPQTKEYTWLENDYYQCDDWLERCEYVNANKCRVLDTKVPNRYLGLVDTCIYLGTSLNNQSIEVPLEIKTSHINQLDQITLRIMDSDRRWNPTENMFTWMTEENGNNIGNPEDIIYNIN